VCVPLAVAAAFGVSAQSARAGVTPGWECIPASAGQAVVSGGTGATPSCAPTTTPVLAPTYVQTGVGGEPTAVFSTVNVQVVSGSGMTNGAVNGMGNLIVGYAENTKSYAQTGSNNLIVGMGNGWTGFGEIVGGEFNRALGSLSAVFGLSNLARGAESSVTGGAHNTASVQAASVAGGEFNIADDIGSWIGAGCANLTGSGTNTGVCGPTFHNEAILGGAGVTLTGTNTHSP
jgi:hypothetical protein